MSAKFNKGDTVKILSLPITIGEVTDVWNVMVPPVIYEVTVSGGIHVCQEDDLELVRSASKAGVSNVNYPRPYQLPKSTYHTYTSGNGITFQGTTIDFDNLAKEAEDMHKPYEIKGPKCECGTHTVDPTYTRHSSWCPLYKEP